MFLAEILETGKSFNNKTYTRTHTNFIGFSTGWRQFLLITTYDKELKKKGEKYHVVDIQLRCIYIYICIWSICIWRDNH